MNLEATEPSNTPGSPTFEPDRVLILSQASLRRTHDYFFPYWQAGVETACFWFGCEVQNYQIVTTIAVPKLYQSPGNYKVDQSSWRRLVHSMRKQNLTNLAQVHTHPIDYGVNHSGYDDERSYSTKPGSLSLVWADYGRVGTFDLDGIGVHERFGDEWVLLNNSKVAERIMVVDDFADFRWVIDNGGINDEE